MPIRAICKDKIIEAIKSKHLENVIETKGRSQLKSFDHERAHCLSLAISFFEKFIGTFYAVGKRALINNWEEKKNSALLQFAKSARRKYMYELHSTVHSFPSLD